MRPVVLFPLLGTLHKDSSGAVVVKEIGGRCVVVSACLYVCPTVRNVWHSVEAFVNL